MIKSFRSVLWCGLMVSSLAVAGSPPAPTEFKITRYTDVEIDVQFRSDASLTQGLTFGSDMTANGRAAAPGDPNKKEQIRRVEDGSPYFNSAYLHLSPDTNYCIRYRAIDGSGSTSAPSAWACVHTVDDMPAPTVMARVATDVLKPRPQITVYVKPATYEWGMARFTIERQLVQLGAASPWVLEVDFQEGLDISQATEDPSPYRFVRTVAAIDPKYHYVYRACAQNWGGKACATADLVSQAAPLGAGGAPPVSAPGTIGSPRVVTTAGQNLQGGAMSRPPTQPERPLNWGAGGATGPSKFPPVSTAGFTAPAPSAIGPGAVPPHGPSRTAPPLVNPQPSALPVSPNQTAVAKPVLEESLSIRQ